MPNPTVHIIATGGSIAGVGPDRMDYIRYPEIGDHLTIDQNLARVPEIGDNFNIIAEDMVSVGSTAIGPANWIALAERIHAIDRDEPDTAGIVITHGTATLEETAYFLHLTVKTQRPVVITGAMRPPTSISTDADLNLLDACRIAATPESAGMGVLTVLNNQIHCAREVYKAQHPARGDLQAQRAGLPGLRRFRPPGRLLPPAGTASTPPTRPSGWTA